MAEPTPTTGERSASTRAGSSPDPNASTPTGSSKPGTAHRHPMAAVLGMALGGFAVGTTEFTTMGLLPQIASGVGVSIPTAGSLVTAYALGVVVGAPVLAVATAHLPRKGVLLALMGLFTLTHLATPLAHTYHALLLVRFLAGLPHGAYFGIAAVVTASMVDAARRAQMVALVLGGLSVAQVLGVPLGTALGQHAGWQWTYVVIGVLGLASMASVGWLVPRLPAGQGMSARSELRSLRNTQVWLTLAVGTIGFGGIFATLSFITPTLTTLTHMPMSSVPLLLMVDGLGSTLGMVLSGRVARRGSLRGIVITLVMTAIWLSIFGPLVHSWPGAVIACLVLGLLPSLLVPMLQTRLLEVAGDGQNLAAALIHSALNVANAFGAWLGAIVLSAGLGYAWPSRAGAVLAVVGVAIAAAAMLLDRRATR